jgi:transposase InsO family protein
MSPADTEPINGLAILRAYNHQCLYCQQFVEFRDRIPFARDADDSGSGRWALTSRGTRFFQRSNTAWVTDMTHLWTPQGLALSGCDHRSVFAASGGLGERIDRKLALDALRMALAQRRPPRGLIQHSDRGSQYASGD